MKILSLLLAEKVNFESTTKKLDIVGIFNTISALGFPAKHKELVVIVVAEGGEKKSHEFLIEITKNGNPIAKNTDNVLTDKRHYYISRFKDIIFREEGIYVISAKIDNQKELSTNLYLKKISE